MVFLDSIYIGISASRMSQGDYIRYKKTGVELAAYDPSSNSVLSYRQYDAFTGYNIENTTVSTSVNYGKQTLPANVIQVFGMKLGAGANAGAACPEFACVKSGIPVPPVPPPPPPPPPPDEYGDY